MRAGRGDWIVIERPGVGQPPRKGRIVGVRSQDGSPPYVVRWAGYGHTTLLFPGPDARILRARGVTRSPSAARSRGRVAGFLRRLVLGQRG